MNGYTISTLVILFYFLLLGAIDDSQSESKRLIVQGKLKAADYMERDGCLHKTSRSIFYFICVAIFCYKFIPDLVLIFSVPFAISFFQITPELGVYWLYDFVIQLPPMEPILQMGSIV